MIIWCLIVNLDYEVPISSDPAQNALEVVVVLIVMVFVETAVMEYSGVPR